MAKKPTKQFRIGRLVASVWENETENGSRYNVTLQRLYKPKQASSWSYSEAFGRDDLLPLGKLLNHAHTWICEQIGSTATDAAA